MRCDANVSVRKKGDTELGTRTEQKMLIHLGSLRKLSNMKLRDKFTN